MKKQLYNYFLFFFFIIYSFEVQASPPVYVTNTDVSESATSARLDSIEKGLDVLQKYIYNLSASKLNNSQSSEYIGNNINIDDIGEQFKSIRLDIENIKQEVDHITDKISKMGMDIESRISDFEELFKEKKDNAKIINKVESQLKDVINDPVEPQLNNSKSLSAAVEQFKSAYHLLKDKNFTGAKSAFEQFIKDNPNDTLIGAAHYWVGQIYTNNGEYDKAVVEHLKGYEVGATSGRAPDNLLKLAESLFKLGKRQESCFTISKLNKEFPNISISIKRSATQLAKDAVCIANPL